MDYKYIEQLLDRYFHAETTIHEEQILRAFFAQGADDMPQELRQWSALFTVVGEQPTLGNDFDERILAMTVDSPKATVVSINKASAVKARPIRLAERMRPLFGAAATIAILLTMGIAISQSMIDHSAWVNANDYAVVTDDDTEPTVAFDQVNDSPTLAKDNITPATVLPTDTLNSSGKVD